MRMLNHDFYNTKLSWYERVEPRQDRSALCFDVVFAFILGFSFAIGTSFFELGYFDWAVSRWISGVVNSICLFIFFVVLRWILTAFGTSREKTRRKNFEISLLRSICNNWKYILLIAAILFLCWLPYLIAIYPGNLSNDTTGQLAMFYSLMQGGDYGLADHHPIFDTMVFGAIVYAGQALFGTFQAGVCLCMVLQMLATALTFGVAVSIAQNRWNTSRTFCWIVVVVLALFPLIPLIVTSLSKDTFSGWIYLWFFLFFLDLVMCNNLQNNCAVGERSGDNADGEKVGCTNFSPGWSFVVAFTLICLLLCLSKKTGIYLVGGILVFYLLFTKQSWRSKARLLIPLILSTLLMFALMPSIFKAADVQSGSKKEMLAIPIQQSALIYIRHATDMPFDQQQQLEEIFDEEKLLAEYNSFIIDPSKDSAVFTSVAAYAKLYAAQALQYPDVYLDAWGTLVSPLFTNEPVTPLFSSEHHTWNNDYLPESYFAKDTVAAGNNLWIAYTYNAISNLPLIGELFSQRLYALILPAFMLLCLVRLPKMRKYWLAIVPIVFGLAFLFFSPTLASNPETMRYLIPSIYGAPLILLFIQSLYGKRLKH